MARGDSEATDASLTESWRLQLGSSPEEVIEPDYHPVHGYDEKLIGIAPPTLAPRELVELIEAACQPADPDKLTIELAKLRAATVGRNLSGADAEAWLLVVGEDLSEYPIDIVALACKRYRRREKWTASSSEIVAECDRLMKRRNAMKNALRRAGEPAPAPKWNPPRAEYTPEQIAEAQALVATMPVKPSRITSETIRRVREETQRQEPPA